MTDMLVLRVLLALLGGTQILRAEPSPAPTVKSAGKSIAFQTFTYLFDASNFNCG